ncbi:hypothetical protein, partial [Stutzerimonas stutzeri]|uniref:hypothetical protein n=1 Tax=Stutzerimonas stutzeri TaxID=316 RepID=UPI002156021E
MNGDIGYIAMQVSGLEVLPGAGLTDSGTKKNEVKNLLQVEDQALGLVSCSSTPVSGYSSVPACSLPSAS